MSVPVIILLVVLGILLLIGLWVLFTFNSLTKKRLNVEEGFATMDVYLKNRYDLIPNLVSTVKGYMKHESDTLAKIVELRNSTTTCTTVEEKQAKEGELTHAVKSLFALAENYPELKANENFVQLQTQLETIEMNIAQSRKYYNAVVKAFNYAIQMFPTAIIARRMKLSTYSMFEVSDANERNNVKVEF